MQIDAYEKTLKIRYLRLYFQAELTSLEFSGARLPEAKGSRTMAASSNDKGMISFQPWNTKMVGPWGLEPLDLYSVKASSSNNKPMLN